MIWIIGNKGMLGQDLEKELQEAGLEVVGTDRDVSILEPEALAAFAKDRSIEWIVNCSAYTAVDRAEEDVEAAYAINRDGVGHIASLAASLDIPLIHMSTDYVFDGKSSTPLNEEAGVAPIGIYGASKLAGEEAIRSTCKRFFILRTAWLYGQYGPNFVYTMIKLMNKLDTLKVVNDQIGSPTWTRDLTGLIKTLVETGSKEYGTFHISGEGQCSWFDFASEIYRQAGECGLVQSSCSLTPCTSSEFPTAAERPAFSLLSKDKVKRVLEYHVPRWQESLESFLKGVTINDII